MQSLHSADLVVHKDGAHQITAVDDASGRWADARSAMTLEELDAVVMGAGQAGLCAAYYLQRAGLRYVAFEKGASCGETWRTARVGGTMQTSSSLHFPRRSIEESQRQQRAGAPRSVLREYNLINGSKYAAK